MKTPDMTRKKKDYDGVFATRLRRLIEGESCTQEVLANNIGVSRTGINKWTSGESVPSIEIASRIAEYFGVSTDYLVGRTDSPTTDSDLQSVCKYTGLNEQAISNIIPPEISGLNKKAERDYRERYVAMVSKILSFPEFRDFIDVMISLESHSRSHLETTHALDENIIPFVCEVFELDEEAYRKYCMKKFGRKKKDGSHFNKEQYDEITEISNRSCDSDHYKAMRFLMDVCNECDHREDYRFFDKVQLLNLIQLTKADIKAIKESNS